jgi:hypothetical protein
MKTIAMILMTSLFAFASLSAETEHECVKKAMDAGAADRKACDGKKGEEKKSCRDAAQEKTSAGKKACFEAANKNK